MPRKMKNEKECRQKKTSEKFSEKNLLPFIVYSFHEIYDT